MTIPFSKLRGVALLLRPHHWIKNGFVLVPAFFGGQILNSPLLLSVIGATFVFCLVSSLVYIINDLRDRDADRIHQKKKERPLASGYLCVRTAILTALLMVAAIGGLLLLLQPPLAFLAIIALYMAINLGHSLGLKHVALAEIFLVASGYILRLAAGAVIAGEHLTYWILVCTGLVALLLTVGKRRGDMAQNNDIGLQRQALRHYTLPYLDHLMVMLAGATIVTYLLFTMSDYAQHRFGPHIVASSVFVIFGIMRYLQIVMVETGGDEPTAILTRDKAMIATLALYLLYFMATLYFV